MVLGSLTVKFASLFLSRQKKIRVSLFCSRLFVTLQEFVGFL